jgi:hypothetical protein
MAILDPILATIVNVPEDHNEVISVNLFPKFPEKGNRSITLT